MDNVQERLCALLIEAEQYGQGSEERTQSLEQIRSILLDRGSTLKHSKSPPSFHYPPHGGSSRLHHHDDAVMLDELFNESNSVLHSIPEAATDRLWGDAAFVEEHEHFDGMHDGTFLMDDLDTPHAPATSHAAAPQTRPPIQPPKRATVALGRTEGIVSATPAVAPAAAAGKTATNTSLRPLSGAAVSQSKPPPAPTSKASTAKPLAKGAGHMSNLAREEQALIPHLPSGATESNANAAPIVLMQLEPEKRLSHKEVEQRRREKAKQYFDELRGLLPFGNDSAKFDKNAILHHSIILLKNLISQLGQEEAASGIKPQAGHTAQSDFRCCFDVSRQPLCFAGLDSRLWDANSAFCTLMGYSRLEVCGLSLLNATAPSDLEASSKHWQAIINGGTKQSNCSYRCKLVRKDGQQIVCNIDLNLISRSGKPHCFLVSANPSF